MHLDHIDGRRWNSAWCIADVEKFAVRIIVTVLFESLLTRRGIPVLVERQHVAARGAAFVQRIARAIV